MPVIDAPTISIYSPAGVFIDWLRAPVAFRATPRWLEVGDAELTVQPGDYRAALLREPGARVRIELRGGHVLGGPVTDWTTQGPGRGDDQNERLRARTHASLHGVVQL